MLEARTQQIYYNELVLFEQQLRGIFYMSSLAILLKMYLQMLYAGHATGPKYQELLDNIDNNKGHIVTINYSWFIY